MNNYFNVAKTIFQYVSGSSLVPHYYGDIVRRLFLLSAAIMLFVLPFFLNEIPVPAYISIISILCITLFAASTNPKQLWTEVVDVLVSLCGVFIFAQEAIHAYEFQYSTFYFLLNECMSIIFLYALYFSTKTLRGRFIK